MTHTCNELKHAQLKQHMAYLHVGVVNMCGRTKVRFIAIIKCFEERIRHHFDIVIGRIGVEIRRFLCGWKQQMTELITLPFVHVCRVNIVIPKMPPFKGVLSTTMHTHNHNILNNAHYISLWHWCCFRVCEDGDVSMKSCCIAAMWTITWTNIHYSSSVESSIM